MLSSIPHSIKQAYKLLTLCAFHYKFYITDSPGNKRRNFNLCKWTEACIAHCCCYRSASSFQIWWPGPDTWMKEPITTVELLVQALKPSAPAIRITSVLALLQEGWRRKLLTTANRPHFHHTVTSQPPSLPNFRQIQMWAQRGVRYLFSRGRHSGFLFFLGGGGVQDVGRGADGNE